MSVRYLKEILESSSNIVCLLGRGSAAERGVRFYQPDFIYDVEEKYGLSPDEIFSSTFYNNRPVEFYRFYREELLEKRVEPDGVNYTLKHMQDDGRLRGIITRGFFNHSVEVGCKNVIALYGSIEHNTCPHCGKVYSAKYVLTHKPLPLCEKCGHLIHPGVSLQGEMLDTQKITAAAELISCADVLLVIGTDLGSPLGQMARYFNGDKIALVNNEEHYTDRKADCVCIGDSLENMMEEAYPGKPLEE